MEGLKKSKVELTKINGKQNHIMIKQENQAETSIRECEAKMKLKAPTTISTKYSKTVNSCGVKLIFFNMDPLLPHSWVIDAVFVCHVLHINQICARKVLINLRVKIF